MTDFATLLESNTTRYEIIYADPPWEYSDKALAGRRGAACKYPVLSIETLKKLPVADICAHDALLFLWVTMPQLNVCMDVIRSWGFTYKTCAFTWVKRNKKMLSWFWGMGRWTRSNAELCLLATRGHPRRCSASVHSIIESPVQDHSRKPDIVRDKIVQLCGDMSRIELFARERCVGWDAWGNDV